MENLFNGIVLPLMTSSVVLGIFIYMIKRYLDRLISHEFDKRKMAYEAGRERSSQASEFVLDRQLGIYPEIAELTYRLRNILRQGAATTYAYQWDSNLSLLCGHLTENLYKYRMFLSEPIFESLHDFKQIAQDALILYDTFTRKGSVGENEEYLAQLELFKPKVEEADRLYRRVIEDLRDRINHIGDRDVV